MRQTIFISHANPQDNDFTVWLASRLQLMGYNVWCDVEGLIGGEKHWEVIDNEIRENAVKFILVVSKDICIKPGQLKEGIAKEFALAESVAKKVNNDFIIPLKIDTDAPYDYFIGLNRYNHVKFHENWATGLKDLISKLEKDQVEKISLQDNKILNAWYANQFTTKFGLKLKKEKYFTNLWPVDEIWDKIEIYQYESATIATEVQRENQILPVIRHGNTLATFGNAVTGITKPSPIGKIDIKSNNKILVNTQNILDKSYSSHSFPTLLDCENILKRLLTRSFHLLARSKGMYWYELASKRNCYYFPIGRRDKVVFSYSGKKKAKNLIGKFKINDTKTGYWHFGITTQVLLYPVVSFSLKSHILFSDDGVNVWLDKSKLHSARRKKGRNWFNEEWRDQLLAIISSLKNSDGKIELKLNEECTIDMPDTPLTLFSPMDYDEPVNKSRLNVLAEESKEGLTISNNTESV